MLAAGALTRCGCSGLARSVLQTPMHLSTVRATLRFKPREHLQAVQAYSSDGQQGGLPPQQQSSKKGAWIVGSV